MNIDDGCIHLRDRRTLSIGREVKSFARCVGTASSTCVTGSSLSYLIFTLWGSCAERCKVSLGKSRGVYGCASPSSSVLCIELIAKTVTLSIVPVIVRVKPVSLVSLTSASTAASVRLILVRVGVVQQGSFHGAIVGVIRVRHLV